MGLKEVLDVLERLGLSEYESRAYFALLRKDGTTAREIANESKVPRTRIYDVLNSLIEKEFIDSEKSRPMKFYARPVEETILRLKKRLDSEIDTAVDEVRKLQKDVKQERMVMYVLRNEESINNYKKRYIEEAKHTLNLSLNSIEDLLNLYDLLLKLIKPPKSVKVYINVYTHVNQLKNEDEKLNKLKLLLNRFDVKLLPAPDMFSTILIDYKKAIVYFQQNKQGFLISIASSMREMLKPTLLDYRSKLPNLRDYL